MSRLATDAKNRALRTFIQGLATDVLAAVILLVLPVFSSATGWQDVDWKVLGFLLAKTATVTALSYVMRAYLDGSSIPTPRPPGILGKAAKSPTSPRPYEKG